MASCRLRDWRQGLSGGLRCQAVHSFLLLLAAVWLAGRALAAAESTRLTPAESFVLKQVAAGKVADLCKPTWRKERQLHSLFLENLLTGHFKDVHRLGVHITGAVFAESLDLNWAHVPYDVALEDCQFQKPVHLRFTRFAKGLSVNHSTFQDEAEFDEMSVAGNLEARGAVFQNEMGVDFEGIEVAHDAYFDESLFNGTATFIAAKIRYLSADGALFLGGADKSAKPTTRRAIIFDTTRVETLASFRDAIFSGPAVFTNSEAGQLSLDRAKFNEATEVTSFQFLRASSLFAVETVFAGPVDFQEARLGTLNIEKAQIKGSKANFAGMHVERLEKLDLNTSTVSGSKPVLVLTGTTYQQLTDTSQWFQLIQQAEWAPQNYSNLEAYLKAHGMTDVADDVFVDMKRRERSFSRVIGCLWGLFLDALVRYGRAPERAFYVAAVFVLFGTALFRRRCDVQAQRAEDEDRRYNSFWYSLDLLVPAIDLQAASVWMPNQKSGFRRNYARLHRILGWVLIPIGLVAVSGLIR